MNYVQKYATNIIRYRWMVLLGTVFTLAVCVMGMSRLGVNTDLRIFFSDENPQLLAFQALENTYTKNDNIFIAVSAKNKTVFDPDVLAVVEKLTKAAWKIPYSHRVDSLTNFQHSYAKDDDLVVEHLVKKAHTLTKRQLENIREIALSEPLLINRLITKDEYVTGINIDVIKPDASANASPEIALYAKQLVNKFRQDHPELDFHLTGWVMLDNTMGEAAQRDLQELIPVMFLLLIIVMGLFIRSISGTVSTVLVIVSSMILGMGVAGWMGIQITGPSSTAPPIILTLALADSIHVLITVFYRMNQGDNKFRAIIESLKINMQPVLITSATTFLGFLAMNFSDAPPFRDLGNIVAAGIAGACLFSLTLLPAMISLLLPKKLKEKEKQKHSNENMRKFSGFVINHRNRIFWATTAVSILLSLGIMRIELNDDFIRYFDERYSYRVASEFVMDNLTGLYTIEYSLNSGKPKGIHDPDFLKKVEKFSQWYETQPEVVHVNSLIPIIKKLNKNMHADQDEYYRIPNDQTYIAQYLLLYELSLPFGHDLNNQINVDKSSLRLTVTLNDVTANQVREIDERARGWLKGNSPDYMYTYGTGLAMMYAHLSERNIKSMLGATFGALILISLILVFAFRSLKYGMISLIPNLMPAIVAFGVWGFTIGRIGIPASVLVSLAVGIVVDDTVHFISKYLHARRNENMSPHNAIQYAFDTVGKALFITTVTLVIGFSVLSISGYKPNIDMGMMTGIIISVALVFDFLFLPTLILKLENIKEKYS